MLGRLFRMKHMFKIALAAGGLALMAPVGASAFPAPASGALQVAPGADDMITQVSGGCGRGWYRDRWGRCRPMVRRAPPPPRRCWIQHTPRGPVRVCR